MNAEVMDGLDQATGRVHMDGDVDFGPVTDAGLLREAGLAARSLAASRTHTTEVAV